MQMLTVLWTTAHYHISDNHYSKKLQWQRLEQWNTITQLATIWQTLGKYCWHLQVPSVNVAYLTQYQFCLYTHWFIVETLGPGVYQLHNNVTGNIISTTPWLVLLVTIVYRKLSRYYNYCLLPNKRGIFYKHKFGPGPIFANLLNFHC